MMPFVDASWTLFLDRDGVINHRPMNDYVKKVDDFVFLPGVIEAIRLLSGIFGRIVIVTNQQGVSLGLMSNDSLDAIHEYMKNEIADGGGKIDLVLACTDTREKTPNCRKPSLSMAKRACEMLPEIDLNKSIMAGDTESDIVFGKNAGMFTVLIGDEEVTVEPQLQCRSLYHFARLCNY